MRKKKAWNLSNPLYRYLHGKRKHKSIYTNSPKKRSMARSIHRKHKYSASKNVFGSFDVAGLLSAAVYGATRTKIAQTVAPKLPNSKYSYPVVAGLAATLIPMIPSLGGTKKILKPVMLLEAAAIGNMAGQEVSESAGDGGSAPLE